MHHRWPKQALLLSLQRNVAASRCSYLPPHEHRFSAGKSRCCRRFFFGERIPPNELRCCRLAASCMSTSSSSSTSIPEARPRGASGQGTAVAEAAAVVAEVDGQAAGGTDDASAVSIDAVPDDSHQKVQAVARLHPSWFKGKGAEAELKETAVTADPRLVTFKGQKIIFMGYLLKFGKTLFKSDWKKRFFVLTPDFLCKFSSRDDYMDGKNADTTIDLYECTVVTAEQETSQPFSFKITCPRFKPAEGSSVTPGFVLLAAENAWELGTSPPSRRLLAL